MARGFTVLRFIPGSYVVSDRICESFPVEIPCYYLNRFFRSEVSRHSGVVTALGYLSLKRFIFMDVLAIFVL